MTVLHSDMHTHTSSFYSWLLVSVYTLLKAGCKQKLKTENLTKYFISDQYIATILLSSVHMRLEAGVKEPTNQHPIAFIALTLLVRHLEEYLASKNWLIRYWRGYLCGARCSGLHMVQLMLLPPHHFLLHWNPERFPFLLLAYSGCPGKAAVKQVLYYFSVWQCNRKNCKTNKEAHVLVLNDFLSLDYNLNCVLFHDY